MGGLPGAKYQQKASGLYFDFRSVGGNVSPDAGQAVQQLMHRLVYWLQPFSAVVHKGRPRLFAALSAVQEEYIGWSSGARRTLFSNP